MSRVDGQRGQDREDPVLEDLLAVPLLVAVEVLPADQVDVPRASAGMSCVAEDPGVPLHQDGGLGPDLVEHLVRHQPGGGANRDAGCDAALEAGHPDHEELVEVAGEDRQETGPLQQREALVLGQLQHALVEPQPGELAVQEPVVELAGVEVVVIRLVRRVDVERATTCRLDSRGPSSASDPMLAEACRCSWGQCDTDR